MKKALFVVLIVLLAALISLSIYYILNASPDAAEPEVPSVPEPLPDSGEVPEDDYSHAKAGADAEDIRESVSHSAVNGYLMLAEEDDINIYEVYDNGYRERIKTLDINPKLMRQNDYRILTEGISVETYTEMCSLIEDFSS